MQPLPTTTIAVWVLVSLAALFFLRFARSLLIPIAIAVLLSYALEPVVAWLERRRVRRVAGAPLAMLAIVGLVAGGVYAFGDDVRQILQTVPSAAEKLRQNVMAQFGSSVLQPVAGAVGTSGGQNGASVTTSAGGVAASLVERIGSSLFEFGAQLVVVFFLTLFLLMAGHHVRNRLVEIAGPDAERRRLTATIIDDINGQIQRYLLVLLFTGAIVGVATWAVLAWMGVQHAAMWGILAGVFNAIPYFGPVVVSGGLFVVGIVQGGGLTQALQMAAAALVITSLEGWLVAPPLMGKAERMHTLAVFLGLLLWTWAPVGRLLAP